MVTLTLPLRCFEKINMKAFLMITIVFSFWSGKIYHGYAQIIDLSPPVAVDDAAETEANTTVAINVVANDYDPDLLGGIDPATVDLNTLLSGIQNSFQTPQGNFTVNSSGIVLFTPAQGFSGTKSIHYTVNDQAGKTSNAATITVTVTAPANVPPVATDDNATTDINTPVTIHVVANDTDSDGTIDAGTVDLNTSQGGIQKSRTTAQGSFTVNESGFVTYTPANSFTGTATLDYTVNDNKGTTSNVATITITVTAPANVPPAATDDNATTDINTPVTIHVVANDTDSDGTIDASTVDLNTSQGGIQKSRTTAQGSFTVNESGFVTYTPANSFTGTATLGYTVNDNKGTTSNVATITITVNSELPVGLDIPTGFTPNGDGANDTWKILPINNMSTDQFEDAEIRVYDKRGMLLFESQGLEKRWDGMFSGRSLPVDAYYYIIDVKSKNIRYKGTVTILR
jgi:gliding motility-associated-like protein